MNPLAAVALQLGGPLLVVGLMWLFRGSIGSVLEDLVKAHREQIAHNTQQEVKLEYVIEKVDDLDGRVSEVERNQQEMHVRQVLMAHDMRLDGRARGQADGAD